MSYAFGGSQALREDVRIAHALVEHAARYVQRKLAEAADMKKALEQDGATERDVAQLRQCVQELQGAQLTYDRALDELDHRFRLLNNFLANTSLT